MIDVDITSHHYRRQYCNILHFIFDFCVHVIWVFVSAGTIDIYLKAQFWINKFMYMKYLQVNMQVCIATNYHRIFLLYILGRQYEYTINTQHTTACSRFWVIVFISTNRSLNLLLFRVFFRINFLCVQGLVKGPFI